MGTAERRHGNRVTFSHAVDYFCWDRPKKAQALEISAEGIFLRTDEVLPEGSMVTLRLRLPGAPRAFTVLGRVARVVLGGITHHSGMGIRFLDITPADRDRIAQYVSQRPELLS